MTSEACIVKIFRVVPGMPDERASGALAWFSVQLFGQLTLHRCHLRQRDDGAVFFVAPWAGASSKGKPRVHVHCGKLRSAITRAAHAAYVTALQDQGSEP